jgi:protein arginine N-methyltransferase 1
MSLVLDEHREYLSDEIRLSRFRSAIAEVVRPGEVVVDLGSGTGVLGLFACKAGAAKVYSIEQGPVMSLTQQICRANGYGDRVTFIKSLSLRAELPERVDVVIADQIGFFGFEAGVLEYFSDARQRFLKQTGKMIPAAIELWAAPVEMPELYANVEFWNHGPGKIDFGVVHSLAVNTAYSMRLQSSSLLSQPEKLATLDLANSTADAFKVESSYIIRRAGRLHGIGGWFSAHLSRNVTMTNSPVAEDRIERRNAFFPIECPLEVVENDRVLVTMHIAPPEKLVSWNVEVWRNEGSNSKCKGIFRQSTFKGMLLGQDDLRHTRSVFIPKRTCWGDARLSVLKLCDGHRQLTEIEKEVYHRHRGLFRSPAEVASFVAEVVMRYTQ